jgi:hypothetical protein
MFLEKVAKILPYEKDMYVITCLNRKSSHHMILTGTQAKISLGDIILNKNESFCTESDLRHNARKVKNELLGMSKCFYIKSTESTEKVVSIRTFPYKVGVAPSQKFDVLEKF